jgi:hypothetical protein
MVDLNSNIMDATAVKDAVIHDMCRYIGLPALLCNYAKNVNIRQMRPKN